MKNHKILKIELIISKESNIKTVSHGSRTHP